MYILSGIFVNMPVGLFAFSCCLIVRAIVFSCGLLVAMTLQGVGIARILIIEFATLLRACLGLRSCGF